MVAWRVFRAIIDPANRTVLQLMTSRYRKLLLANGACVARLTCVSLCQFKELVRCTARFLTFVLWKRRDYYFTSPTPRTVSLSYFPWFRRATERDSTRSAIVVRFRDYAARVYIYFSNQRRNLVSLLRLSRLCLLGLVSSLTDFSRLAAAGTNPTYIRVRALVFASTLLRVRTPRNDSLVPAFDAT